MTDEFEFYKGIGRPSIRICSSAHPYRIVAPRALGQSGLGPEIRSWCQGQFGPFADSTFYHIVYMEDPGVFFTNWFPDNTFTGHFSREVDALAFKLRFAK
jgi:hypothetical protein